MLSARTAVEGVMRDDVGWVLAGHKLERVSSRLAGAAADARAGAEQVADAYPDAAERLQHAAALISDPALTTSRDAWNSRRSGLAEARDAINDAIVATRDGDALALGRAADEQAVAQLAGRWTNRPSEGLGAEDWTRFADLAELPVGERPLALEHVTAKDVKLLREQAARMAEGLPGSKDPRLAEMMQATELTTRTTQRSGTEAVLERAARELVDGSDTSGTSLRTIAVLQRLDGTLRPRALEATGDVAWLDAARLQEAGGTVPPRWSGLEHLRRSTELGAPQAVLHELLQDSPTTWSSSQWQRMSSLVRLPAQDRPAQLAGLTKRHARQMDTVARMVDRGEAIPASWKGMGSVRELRGAELWSSRSTATAHLKSIVDRPSGQLTRADFDDLDSLRLLPDDVRPAGLDAADETWRAVAASTEEPAARVHGAARQKLASIGVAMKSPEELRAVLDRIGANTDELAQVQERYGSNAQVPRGILTRFAGDLTTLRAFRHEATQEKKVWELMDDTEQLVQHNIDRLDGLVRGGYGRHVDYADLGRIRENVRTFTAFARLKLDAASPTAAAVDAPAPAAAEQAVETLTW